MSLQPLDEQIRPSATEFAIPTVGSQPVGITRGADGNLWFAELHAIGHITPAGISPVTQEITAPTESQLIATEPDAKTASTTWSSAGPGGSPDDGGGRFTRSTATHFYGDTDLGGTLTLNQPFSASGEFNANALNAPDVGTGLVLGHFAAAGVGQVGIVFNHDAPNLYWRAYIRFDDFTDVNMLANAIAPNVARTWSCSWDAAGGTQGGGC